MGFSDGQNHALRMRSSGIAVVLRGNHLQLTAYVKGLTVTWQKLLRVHVEAVS